MRGQSVGIYPVRNSMPEPIISELERIIDSGEGGLSQSLVKLQPIARLNAIMVISSKPALLRTAATWITRLDKSDTAATGVKVYQVRYGDARLLAQLLNDIFGGGGGRGLVDSATNQIAPGSGVATSTTHDGPAERPAAAGRAQRAGWVIVGFAAERHGKPDRRHRRPGRGWCRWPAAAASEAQARTTWWRAAAARSDGRAPAPARARSAAAASAAEGEAISRARSCRACASPPTRSTTRC